MEETVLSSTNVNSSSPRFENGFWDEFTFRGLRHHEDDLLPEGCNLTDVCIMGFTRTSCRVLGNRYFFNQIWNRKHYFDYFGQEVAINCILNAIQQSQDLSGRFLYSTGGKFEKAPMALVREHIRVAFRLAGNLATQNPYLAKELLLRNDTNTAEREAKPLSTSTGMEDEEGSLGEENVVAKNTEEDSPDTTPNKDEAISMKGLQTWASAAVAGVGFPGGKVNSTNAEINAENLPQVEVFELDDEPPSAQDFLPPKAKGTALPNDLGGDEFLVRHSSEMYGCHIGPSQPLFDHGFLEEFVRRGIQHQADDAPLLPGYIKYQVYLMRFTEDAGKIFGNRYFYNRVWYRRKMFQFAKTADRETQIVQGILDQIQMQGGGFLCPHLDEQTGTFAYRSAPTAFALAHIRLAFRIANSTNLPGWDPKKMTTLPRYEQRKQSIAKRPYRALDGVPVATPVTTLPEDDNGAMIQNEITGAMIQSEITGAFYEIDFVMAALRNYESFNGLKMGSAKLAEVEATSAGVEGWAFTVLQEDYHQEEESKGIAPSVEDDSKPAAISTTPNHKSGRGDAEEMQELQRALLESVGVNPSRPDKYCSHYDESYYDDEEYEDQDERSVSSYEYEDDDEEEASTSSNFSDDGDDEDGVEEVEEPSECPDEVHSSSGESQELTEDEGPTSSDGSWSQIADAISQDGSSLSDPLVVDAPSRDSSSSDFSVVDFLE